MITHQNALTQTYQVSAYALQEKIGSALRCLFSPEHGWNGQGAEGEKINHGFDPHLNLPVFSLYGKPYHLQPMFRGYERAIILVRRLIGWYENRFIEIKGLPHLFSYPQMPEVNRIKCAAHYGYTHRYSDEFRGSGCEFRVDGKNQIP
ncbi:MAG: hypothetical protein A2W62_04265 [Alphaproteobacteria bacterium RIFCSPLOWO2_02_42_7]|nr:MAG: hypothetical protein A2W62_04265 [Alphaproteobacteria bacterium RIFCSPLOWO2_02_42_7]